MGNLQKIFEFLIWGSALSFHKENLGAGFFLPYLLVLYWNRTSPVAGVYSLVQTIVFVLCSPQGSSIRRIPSVLRNGQVRNQFLGHHLKRLKCFMCSLCIVVELVCILVAESMYCWIGVLMGKKRESRASYLMILLILVSAVFLIKVLV